MAQEMCGKGIRVLLAEDEPLIAMVIEDALADAGFAVLTAGDGRAALDLATAGAGFDVLVTDLAMPHLGGLELIPRLRARRPGLPVVVMTGYLPPGTTERLSGQTSGPLAVLRKPFAMEQLVEALARMTAPAAGRRTEAEAGVVAA